MLFTASLFQQLYKTGKLGMLYQDIYFLKNLIKEGDYAADIGAHLGYYTFELSRLAGKNGKVVAIEPVTKFNDVLKKLIVKKKNNNIELYKIAVGGKDDTVEIGIPIVSNQKRYGRARLKELHENFNYAETETVANVRGDEFFNNLPRLDFIKCDIEGAEVPAFLSMLKTIEKNTPIILCELGDKNERIKMYNMLLPLSYSPYILKNKILHPLDSHMDENAVSFNYYFIPNNRKSIINELVSK